MPKFVILDQTLRSVGGHNLEYDVHVLRAARRHGWQPVLAAHWDLSAQRDLVENCEVYLPFRDDSYESLLHKLQRSRRRLAAAPAAGETDALASRWRNRINWWQYRWRYEHLRHNYRTALDELWSRCRPRRGDQVFLATTMPLDIAGLAEWARRNPSAREVDWHLQFHFPLVDAETWYAESSREYGHLLKDLPATLQDLLGALTRDRVHLYATTETLAAQHAHCLGEPFQTLPLPINPALAGLRAAVAGRKPLRALCAGEPRLEKGAEHWSRIVTDLTADYFATGRLQLALQADSYDVLPEPLRRLAGHGRGPIDRQFAERPVALAEWPLNPADYLEFLASANIGLLMYDPLAYHDRLSGVMVELLGAGVPVVVPAGCALADQIAEPIFAHQEQLREQLAVVANRTTAELDWKVAVQNPAAEGITVGVDTPCATVPAAVAQTAVPAHASHLLLLLERDAPNAWNRYTAVSAIQRDAEGRTLARSRDIIGYRAGGQAMTVLVPLARHSRQIEIRLQTAFGHEPLQLLRLDCCFLATNDASRVPHGAVGRLASDPGQAAACLRDIVDHYEHYERTAQTFAATWAPEHAASQVLHALTTQAEERVAECLEVG